jgi:NAD(P)H-dependent FMN reductase
MLRAFLEGVEASLGDPVETYHLAGADGEAGAVQAFAEARAVILGFPLYTDAMPGIVKAFIEALEPHCARPEGPELIFLVQSGFPEAIHSRAVEAYLERLAGRLNGRYVGTIVKPSGEGTRLRPQERNASLYARLRELGRSYATKGELDRKVLALLGSPERFPFWLSPIVRLFFRTNTVNFFWDRQLRENGVFEERFARPYDPT